MTLPKELTTVTLLSKYTALFLFIFLPFIGFYLGTKYQTPLDLSKGIEEKQNLLIERAPTPTPLVMPTVNPSVTANWKRYENTLYGFTISYPSFIKLYTTDNGATMPSLGFIPLCDGIVCFYYSFELYDNPNFAGASVSVNPLDDVSTASGCNRYAQFDLDLDPIIPQRINGITFYKASFEEGATGHLRYTQYYHTFHNLTCYEIALNIGATSPNVDPGELSENDINNIFMQLDQILSTFRFIDQ